MTGESWPLAGAFEADAWAGLVVAFAPGIGAALRLLAERDGAIVDPAEMFLRVHEVGPHEPSGRYARVAFDLRQDSRAVGDTDPAPVSAGEASIVWEWAHLRPGFIACRLSAARAVRVWLQGAAPWDWPVTWTRTAGGLRAIAGGPGTARSLDVDLMSPIAAEAVGHVQDSDRVPLDLDLGAPAVFVIRMPADGGDITPDDVRRDLERAREAWASRRVRVSGAWEGLADAVTSSLHWMTLLQPESMRRYVPAGRRWIFPTPDGRRDHWTIFAWDGFFNALLASLDDHALACSMVDAVLDTQYPTGNVPNWRSRLGGTPDRSQPPIGAFVVSRLVMRSGDLDLARRALPRLERWHAWWSGDDARTGRRRPSGLFAWGSDLDRVNPWVPSWEREASPRQKAAWESGQDDLPNWDDVPWDARTNTLALDCVDLSALLALDAECLAWLSDALGHGERAAAHRREHARLCATIDGRLWDDARGVYADRRPDGTFSRRIAASNFYPLLAGVASGERLARALACLTDPSQFWGTWIVPTISRRDPAHADQQYWRGTIWPPVNLLLYEALRRVRAGEAASHLASRGAAMFLDDWRRHQVCRENFSSVDGRGGGQRHQSWGPLFAWTGLAEFADVTPWDGLRLGTTHAREVSTLDRLRLGGHDWRITIGPDRFVVSRDGHEWFHADAPLCLRHVHAGPPRWRAVAEARRETRISWPDGRVQGVAGGHTVLEGPIGRGAPDSLSFPS